jgi:hypothetical protein
MLNRPSRGSLLEALKQKNKAQGDQVDRSEIFARVRDGKVIPIIGGSVHFDQVFKLLVAEDISEPVDEALARTWADLIGYPLKDTFDLARVALYNHVQSDDPEHARRKYLTFLKQILVELGKSDESVSDVAFELEKQVNEMSLSGIANDLGYPAYPSPEQDPLRLLARLNLPIYVTTSYFDFLERAIITEGRTPRTQVCFWSGDETNVLPEHLPDPNFRPTPATPLVYHLFGFEKYPRTMVLSEDDYLAFLAETTKGPDVHKPVIPLYLADALRSMSLILLGYHLHDWDFRVLFRGIIKPGLTTLRSFGLVVQLEPGKIGMAGNPEEANRYLKEYFEDADFKVVWGESETYLHDLWKEWTKWVQGQ